MACAEVHPSARCFWTACSMCPMPKLFLGWSDAVLILLYMYVCRHRMGNMCREICLACLRTVVCCHDTSQSVLQPFKVC